MNDRSLAPTPGQTVGPFYGYALPYVGDSHLVPPGRPGSVRLSGHVYDGAGDPVPDALLELWQADPDGVVPQRPGSLHRDGFDSTGWGRCATDPAGHYAFSTVTPGPVDGGAAFFAITVFARGLMHRLQTRAYLPGVDPESDPLLLAVEPDRRTTLLATADEHGFVFDLRLQGEAETVFLTYPRD